MSVTTVSSLQAAIEKRAAEKLDNALADLENVVRGHSLLMNSARTPNLSYKGEEKPPYWMFKFLGENWGGKAQPNPSQFMADLRAMWLPVFIEQEVQELLACVDNMASLDEIAGHD